MNTRTLQGLRQRHDELLTDFRRRLAASQREGGIAKDAIVRDKTRLLESIEGRLAEARQAREATVARLDAGIAALEERVTALRTEIETDAETIDPRRPADRPPRDIPGLRRPRPTPAPPRPAPPRPAPPRPAGPSVTDIHGVGPAYGQRLEAAGVTTAGQVAKMKPAKLAETLSISEDRAKALVAAAKKVK